MASDLKLFRPWAPYSADLKLGETRKDLSFGQTDLTSEEASRLKSAFDKHIAKKRSESSNSKQCATKSAFSSLNQKQNTWCNRKRELSERKSSNTKPTKRSNQELISSPTNGSISSIDRSESTSSSQDSIQASSESSGKCDNSFSDKVNPFGLEHPDMLDPLCMKSPPFDAGFSYLNYPNFYDPGVLPYGLSAEEFFGCKGDFLYANSADPWGDLAKFYSQTGQSKVKQRPKKFQCPHCNVAFSNNGQLKGHVRIHTGERPFKCDVDGCGKSFTRNEELTRHKRIHSGLRPFGCPHCGKKFGRKDHLKKHARTHLPQPRFAPQLVPLYPFLYGY